MTDTPRLDLPEIDSGQSDKSVTHNDALQLLDILVQTAVIDKDLSTPPGSPSDGDLYIVKATGTGAWSGHDNDLAYYRSTWVFVTPFEGLRVDVKDEDITYRFDGAAWVSASSSIVSGSSTVRVATTANITISTALNNGDTLDGVSLVTGDLVLVKNQSSAAENGVYVVGVSPARATAFDTYDEHPGVLLTVQEGTTNADTAWLCTSNKGGTLNSTAISFAAYPGANTTASTTEVLTGTDTAKAVTPDALAALWEKGADTASAGTTALGEGGFFHVTGTTTITDIDWSTAKDGRVAFVVFDGALTLTHNATTLKLPGGANITTAAGDRACFVQDNSDNVVCLFYQKADGTAVVGSITAASTTEVLTGTNTTKAVTPDALAALWEKGSDTASSGTVSLDEGGFFHITGTTTITDIDWTTAKDGRCGWVVFDGALTLTHNSTTLKLPGNANITTAAGDRALFVQDSSDNVICLVYVKANGQPVVGSGGGDSWFLQWSPLVNEPPSSNFATLDSRNSHPCLDFDATTQEAAIFSGTLPADYAGAGITVSVWCSLTSATSGTVGWLVSIERMDASSLDIDADSFASAQTITATTVPGTSGQLLKLSVNISNGANMDSLAAGEMFRIKIERDVSNDTATGDAELLRVMMVEQ